MTSSQSHKRHSMSDGEESSSQIILKQEELTTRSQISDLVQQLSTNNSATGRLSLGDLPPEEQFGFESMPNEVLCNVLKYLPSNDLLNFALCSNEYGDVAWYKLKKRDFLLTSMQLSVESVKSPHGIETSRYELSVSGVSLKTIEGNQDRICIPSLLLNPSSVSYSYVIASRIAAIMSRLLRKGDVSKMKLDIFQWRPENTIVKRMTEDVMESLLFYLGTAAQQGSCRLVSIDVLYLTPESVCLLDWLSPERIEYRGATKFLFSPCGNPLVHHVASIRIINDKDDNMDNFMEKCSIPLITVRQGGTWSNASFIRGLTNISMSNEPRTIICDIRGSAKKWQQMFSDWVSSVRPIVASRVQMKIDEDKLEVSFQRGGSYLDPGEPVID